ncbi:hypothetical protein KAU32_00535 [bacterium]|nr:hypothetical protein [bacterium]
MKRILAVIGVLLLSLIPFSTGFGGEFFNEILDAKSIALGYTSLSDLSTDLTNPAAMEFAEKMQISINYLNIFSDSNVGVVTGVFPLKIPLTLGLKLSFLSSVDIEMRSDTNEVLDMLSGNRKFGVQLTQSYRFNKDLTMGISEKIGFDNYDDTVLFGFDVGSIWRIDESLLLAVSLKKMANDLDLNLGGKLLWKNFTLYLEYFALKSTLGLGTSYNIFNLIKLRAGYKSDALYNGIIDSLAGLTFGLGLSIEPFDIDISFFQNEYLGNTYIVSSSYRFGEEINTTRKIYTLSKPLDRLWAEGDIIGCFDNVDAILNIDKHNSKALAVKKKIKPILGDTEKPKIEIIGEIGEYTNDEDFGVTVNAIDNIALKRCTFDGEKSEAIHRKEYKRKYYKKLTPGKNTILVETEDLNNNISKRNIEIIYDDKAPNIVFGSKINKIVDREDVTFDLKVTDNYRLDRVRFNEKIFDCSDLIEKILMQKIKLKPGTNSININATDAAGNEHVEAFEIIYDIERPNIKLVGKLVNVTHDKEYDLELKVTDNGLLREIQINNEIIKCESINSKDISRTVSLAKGNNTIYVTAIDTVGNKEHKIYKIVYEEAAIGERKIPIAVLDFEENHLEEGTARIITEFIRQEMINSGEFYVLERSAIDQILKEVKFQQTGCTSAECAVEVGKILAVKKMIVGSVSRLGKKYFINIRMVDVETSNIDIATSVGVIAPIEELPDHVNKLVNEIVEHINK